MTYMKLLNPDDDTDMPLTVGVSSSVQLVPSMQPMPRPDTATAQVQRLDNSRSWRRQVGRLRQGVCPSALRARRVMIMLLKFGLTPWLVTVTRVQFGFTARSIPARHCHFRPHIRSVVFLSRTMTSQSSTEASVAKSPRHVGRLWRIRATLGFRRMPFCAHVARVVVLCSATVPVASVVAWSRSHQDDQCYASCDGTKQCRV